MTRKRISGWGRYPIIEGSCYITDCYEKIKGFVADKRYIARGLGRSYGDSSLSEIMVLSSAMDNFLGFDPENGRLFCEAGVSLEKIIRHLLPRGWFLPVTPGTKFITIGGAIASDVHGKNHHKDGCFSNFIDFFYLLLPDCSIIRCSRTENNKIFKATFGGMGLTGIILSAGIRLKRVKTPFISQTTIKANDLKRLFELFELYKNAHYSVAWIDCLASKDALGRGIFIVGEHEEGSGAESGAENADYTEGKAKNNIENTEIPLTLYNKPVKNIPFDLPDWILNNYTIKAFNRLYWHKQLKMTQSSAVHLDPFFYPLDAIHNWNRLYGKKGFLQYQFVVPLERSYEAIKTILKKISSKGIGSFLSVLKRFGKGNDCPLSFPMEGYTLALDFKIQPQLFDFLDMLDEIVIDYGGRIYLTKDARMKQKTFEKGYLMLNDFMKIRDAVDPKRSLMSLQARRLGL